MSKTEKLIQLQKKMLRHFGKGRLVFGSGNPDAGIVFVGESPGAAELEQDRPFVGQAGKLLDQALDRARISRKEVYITNAIKFRLKKKDIRKEVKLFRPFLQQELEIIQPDIVCALGSTALEALTGSRKFAKLRGKVVENERPVFVTFHPAAARFPKNRKKFFADIKKLAQFA